MAIEHKTDPSDPPAQRSDRSAPPPEPAPAPASNRGDSRGHAQGKNDGAVAQKQRGNDQPDPPSTDTTEPRETSRERDRSSDQRDDRNEEASTGSRHELAGETSDDERGNAERSDSTSRDHTPTSANTREATAEQDPRETTDGGTRSELDDSKTPLDGQPHTDSPSPTDTGAEQQLRQTELPVHDGLTDQQDLADTHTAEESTDQGSALPDARDQTADQPDRADPDPHSTDQAATQTESHTNSDPENGEIATPNAIDDRSPELAEAATTDEIREDAKSAGEATETTRQAGETDSQSVDTDDLQDEVGDQVRDLVLPASDSDDADPQVSYSPDDITTDSREPAGGKESAPGTGISQGDLSSDITSEHERDRPGAADNNVDADEASEPNTRPETQLTLGGTPLYDQPARPDDDPNTTDNLPAGEQFIGMDNEERSTGDRFRKKGYERADDIGDTIKEYTNLGFDLFGPGPSGKNVTSTPSDRPTIKELPQQGSPGDMAVAGVLFGVLVLEAGRLGIRMWRQRRKGSIDAGDR